MTPRWLDAPKPPLGLPHIPLHRIKPGNPLRLAITTSDLLGVPTHYMGRRTLPCVHNDCPGCDAKLATRDEWYCGAWVQSPSRHLIIALTPNVAWEIRDRFREATTLRGCLITLSRAGRAGNSRLICQCELTAAAGLTLPPEPDLAAHLLHIWGLDQTQINQEAPGYANRVKEHYRGNGAAENANAPS